MLKSIFVISLFLSVQTLCAQIYSSYKPESVVLLKNNANAVNEGINRITIMSFIYSSVTDSSLQSKEVRGFDDSGNLILEETYSWDKYGVVFMKEDKMEYEYDSRGNQITYTYWYGNYNESNEWVKNRIEYTGYNDNDLQVLKVVVGFNPSAVLDTIEIHRKKYNDSNVISEEIDSLKKFVDNTYIWDVTKTGYFYDEFGNDTTVVLYGLDAEGNWVASLTTYYKYNTDNKMIETSSTDGVNWGSLIKYSYNTEGLPDTTYAYRAKRDGDSIIWNICYKSAYSYNSSGAITRISQWTLDYSTNELYLSQQNDNVYDANGTLIETIRMRDNDNKGLVNESKETFDFDESGNLTEDAEYRWMVGDNTWLKQKYKVYVYIDGLLRTKTGYYSGYPLPQSRDVYYYNDEVVTGTQLNAVADITVFPNPTEDFVMIHLNKLLDDAKYSVFDMMGKRIVSRNIISTDVPVNMTALNSGTYILKIEENNKHVKSFKIVKR